MKAKNSTRAQPFNTLSSESKEKRFREDQTEKRISLSKKNMDLKKGEEIKVNIQCQINHQQFQL